MLSFSPRLVLGEIPSGPLVVVVADESTSFES